MQAELTSLIEQARLRRQLLDHPPSFDVRNTFFAEALDLLEIAREGNYDAVPERVLGPLRTLIAQVNEILGAVPAGTGDPKIDAPLAPAVQGYVRNLERSMGEAVPALALVRQAHATLRHELARFQHESMLVLEEQRAQRATMTEVTTESQRLLASVRESVASKTIAEHAVGFETVSRSHRIASRWWLGATVASALGLGWMVRWQLLLAIEHAPPASPAAAINIAVAKLIAFSLAAAGVLWLGRNFRIARHNSVVNEHRASALRSFDAIPEATTSASVRDAVLLQVTHTIFAPQPTGFIGADGETNPMTQILEVYKGAAGAAGGKDT